MYRVIIIMINVMKSVWHIMLSIKSNIAPSNYLKVKVLGICPV